MLTNITTELATVIDKIQTVGIIEGMEMILEREFCTLVESRLSDLKWSRSELARQMKVGPQYVTDYLNGRKKPGPEVIEKFFGAMGLVPHLTAAEK